MLQVQIDEHPLLELGLVRARLPRPLGELPSPAWLVELLRPDAEAPFEHGDDVRAEARNLLRGAGYKPTGRGKPASEYLVRAAAEGTLGSINLAVDVNNAVSLHSGLPISVVDAALVVPPLRVGLAGEGASYVFNASGQEIRLDGLLCLFDAEGPCANAVKDSQRTKTSAATTELLVLVWGTRALPGRTRAAVDWYASLIERGGAEAVERDVR